MTYSKLLGQSGPAGLQSHGTFGWELYMRVHCSSPLVAHLFYSLPVIPSALSTTIKMLRSVLQITPILFVFATPVFSCVEFFLGWDAAGVGKFAKKLQETYV